MPVLLLRPREVSWNAMGAGHSKEYLQRVRNRGVRISASTSGGGAAVRNAPAVEEQCKECGGSKYLTDCMCTANYYGRCKMEQVPVSLVPQTPSHP